MTRHGDEQGAAPSQVSADMDAVGLQRFSDVVRLVLAAFEEAMAGRRDEAVDLLMDAAKLYAADLAERGRAE